MVEKPQLLVIFIGSLLSAARMILLRAERDRPAVIGITQMIIPEKVVCMPHQLLTGRVN